MGGMSTEHDVSVVSGMSVLKNINQEKYEVFPICINKQGKWYQYKGEYHTLSLEVGDSLNNLEEIKNVFDFLKRMDIVFPVLHGLYGEDGTIQGLLELLQIPYVGCRVLASSVAMDKVYTKILLNQAGIKQANYLYIRKKENQYYHITENFEESILHLEKDCKWIVSKLGLPLFVKPSNSGSSVGIRKVNSQQELISAIDYAAQFDSKILLEQNIEGLELECAVLGTNQLECSCVGQITPAEEFYSFEAKYKNQESKLTIPAQISKEESEKIREIAKKAFRTIDGSGLARVDFFLQKESGQIILNEINTMPGFTSISMYTKLWEKTGKSYSQIIEELIELAKKE